MARDAAFMVTAQMVACQVPIQRPPIPWAHESRATTTRGVAHPAKRRRASAAATEAAGVTGADDSEDSDFKSAAATAEPARLRRKVRRPGQTGYDILRGSSIEQALTAGVSAEVAFAAAITSAAASGPAVGLPSVVLPTVATARG